jgi:hypothetical protein
VQPLEARKNPLWWYTGEKDVDRISRDLSVKDLEKFVRRFSSLIKKDGVPTSCRVKPYISSHALPEVSNLSLSFLTAILFHVILVLMYCLFDRTMKLFLLFLPCLRVEKWMSEPSLLTSRKNPLALEQKSRDLTNPWLPLKEKLHPRLPSQPIHLLPLFHQGTREKEVMLKTPAPPSLAVRLSKKLLQRGLLPKKRGPSTLTMMPS